MAKKDTQAAAEHASRASTQAKHAVRNVARAAEDIVDPFVEDFEREANHVVNAVRSNAAMAQGSKVIIGLAAASGVAAFAYLQYTDVRKRRVKPVPPL